MREMSPYFPYIIKNMRSVPLFPIKAEGASEGTFGHNGFTGCNVIVIPAKKTIIIFLTNRQNKGLGGNRILPKPE